MNLNYEQKYLKYKKKYLNLRNKKSIQKGGDIAEPMVVMPNTNSCTKHNNDPERCNEEKDCMYYSDKCRDIVSRDEDDIVDRMDEPVQEPVSKDCSEHNDNRDECNKTSRCMYDNNECVDVKSWMRAQDDVPSGPVSSGPVASGPVASGPVSSGPVASGPVSSGPVASGPVSSYTSEELEDISIPSVEPGVLVDDNNKLDSNWLNKIRPDPQKVVNWNELPRTCPQKVVNWNELPRPDPQQNTQW